MTIGTVASRGDRRHFTIRFTSHHAGSSVYGVVVQAIARHADLDVTMRIYAHTNLDSMREAVDKIDWGAA
jgi:integrase